MSEENTQIEDAQILEKDQPQEDVNDNNNTQQSSSVEEEAKQHGWVPPEEAVAKGVDPDKVVDASTFMDREPFLKRINMLEKRNHSMAQKLDQVLGKFDQAEYQGYQRAIQELESQKKQAYEEMDTDRLQEIDKQLDENKEALNQFNNKRQQPEPETLDFIKNNEDWWNKDVAAMQFAVATEAAIMNSTPNLTPEERYNEVQKRVDAFRGVSGSKPKAKAPPVAPSTRGGSAGRDNVSYAFGDLNKEAKDIYMTMKDYHKDEFGKDYSVDEFIKAQKKVGTDEKDLLSRS